MRSVSRGLRLHCIWRHGDRGEGGHAGWIGSGHLPAGRLISMCGGVRLATDISSKTDTWSSYRTPRGNYKSEGVFQRYYELRARCPLTATILSSGSRSFRMRTGQAWTWGTSNGTHTKADCVFRSNPSTDSGPTRPPIPQQAVHLFRTSVLLFRRNPSVTPEDGGGRAVHAQNQGSPAAEGRGAEQLGDRAQSGDLPQHGSGVRGAGLGGGARLAFGPRVDGCRAGDAALPTAPAVERRPVAPGLAAHRADEPLTEAAALKTRRAWSP